MSKDEMIEFNINASMFQSIAQSILISSLIIDRCTYVRHSKRNEDDIRRRWRERKLKRKINYENNSINHIKKKI